MKNIKAWFVRHPILFGFVLIVLFVLLSTLTWPISQLFPYPEGSELGISLSKLTLAGCFIGMIWALGWMKESGFTYKGERHIWQVVLVMMFIKVALNLYVFTGSSKISLPGWQVCGGILVFTFATSLLEESMFRGLLLTAMLKAWGRSRKGILLSAVGSAVFWGSLHLANLADRTISLVLLQVFSMMVIGTVYGIVVALGKSIWTAVVFHWATNAVVSLGLTQIPAFEETISLWIWLTLISAVILVFSVVYLRSNDLPTTEADSLPAINEKRQSAVV